MSTQHDYRVVPVIRYIVTHHQESPDMGSTVTCGEFETPETAHEVAYALASEKSRELGALPDSMQVIFPSKDYPLRRLRDKVAEPLTRLGLNIVDLNENVSKGETNAHD